VSSTEVDQYLAGLEEPKRTTLEQLRRTILEIVPEAAEGLSYRLPAFRLDGKVIAGFAAFKHHLSYLPHSGSVFPAMADELTGYKMTTGSLHFAVDTPLPKWLVERLLEVKVALAFPGRPFPGRSPADPPR
jgi:uncharacterized protein YdhG (YjbR/CyaY superfamily)